jgi:hypothetical protein
MLAIAKRLGRGRTATAKKNPVFPSEIIEVSIAVPQIKLIKIAGDQIGAIPRSNKLNRHPALLFQAAA